MIIMFSFVAKGRLCENRGSVNNNPGEPEKFHIFFFFLKKKHITKIQFFQNIYQNVPVDRKDVKNYEGHTEVTEHYYYETVSTFKWDVKIITLGEVGNQRFKRRGL
jgi:hypothetical protein